MPCQTQTLGKKRLVVHSGAEMDSDGLLKERGTRDGGRALRRDDYSGSGVSQRRRGGVSWFQRALSRPALQPAPPPAACLASGGRFGVDKRGLQPIKPACQVPPSARYILVAPRSQTPATESCAKLPFLFRGLIAFCARLACKRERLSFLLLVL
ncbi:hypothetical protein P280DRAFT_481324 [Massarina eburnea CBS 473.64]|uniref:Uncharacterized protein n=1 Tax=Massarina eburnea CBS 473.64 TaxID=1395130 RepID=A0A6A6RVW0_9PLEO|nr:hypothetical protein P280DRAFT_481324 [Massarina eburnea CBS 473.64]